MSSPKKHVAWEQFEDYVSETGLKKPLTEICRQTYVTLEEVFSSRRSMVLTRARGRCWTWLHEHGRSLTEIGDMWGRNHTTVLFAIRAVRALQSSKPAA